MKQKNRSGRGVWRWILFSLGVSFLVGAARLRLAQHGGRVETVRVRAASTTSSNAGVTILNATGYIIAAHKIELASEVSGRVAWIGVEKGDKVKQGQVLVGLEDEEFRASDRSPGPIEFAQSPVGRARKRLAPRRDRAQPGRPRTGSRRPGERPRDAQPHALAGRAGRPHVEADARRRAGPLRRAGSQIRVVRRPMRWSAKARARKRSTPCARRSNRPKARSPSRKTS